MASDEPRRVPKAIYIPKEPLRGNSTMTSRAPSLQRRLLQQAWFGSALLTIVIPLVIFYSSRWANHGDNDYNNNGENNNGENNNNNNNSSPWWFMSTGNGDRNDEGAAPALIATYLWSMLVFLGIVF
jgi:hypothetical protein